MGSGCSFFQRPTDINAVSTMAPMASSTVQMATKSVVFFLSSCKPMRNPCRSRRNSQMLSVMAVAYAANSIHATGVMKRAIKAKTGGYPPATAIAPTAVPVLNIIYRPSNGPITGTNMTRQMRRLFPKMNCASAPSLPIVVTVWFRSLLIWFAS